MAKTLVLFTIEYPFGKSESFLETEIKYLSKEFQKVFIVPTRKVEGERITPKNVFILNDVQVVYDGKFHLSSFIKVIIPFLKTYIDSFILSSNRMPYLRSFKSFAHHFLNEYQKKDAIFNVINKHDIKDSLFYDYWFTNSLLALVHLKKKGLIKNIIARAHRFDLYDNIQTENLIPFREYKIRQLDKLFIISNHGMNHINKSLTKQKYRKKVKLSYLGVPKHSINNKQLNNTFTIVSCARLIPLKNIHKIALALKEIRDTVNWIHFGEGPEKEKIVSIASNFPSNINLDLKGQVSNESIISFYKENHVDVFISMSSSEGLPVSIMEAQSFGIPVIAPAVNGIPEIVNSKTGILLDRPETELLRNELNNLILNRSRFNRNIILDFFDANFNADINYTKFINEIKSI